jgi:hypothetical protein
MSEIAFSGNCFPKGKTRGPSPRVRGPRQPGPPLIGGHCRAQELAGARPPAAPVPESSDRRGGGEEGRVGKPNGEVAAAWEAMEGRLTGGGSFGSEGRRRGRSEG